MFLRFLQVIIQVMDFVGGNSESWAKTRKRAFDVVQLFCIYATLPPWETLGEDSLCGENFYNLLATYLTETYQTKPKGNTPAGFLAPGSVFGYFGCILQFANEKFATLGDDSSKLFLSCVDGSKVNTVSARWLRKLKVKMGREMFARMRNNGEELDKSETPVYSSHIKSCNAAYALAGTTKAVIRKLALTLCQRATGRASEVGWVTYDGLEWDPHFQTLFAELPQMKTSKCKIIAFAAGADRHCCPFLDWGDYWTLQPLRRAYNPTGANWVIPELQSTNTPGTTLGSYIKALIPNGPILEFQDYCVAGLPPDATAGGIRAGCCNELGAVMPVEIAVRGTGHEVVAVSTFFRYCNPTHAFCMAASIVLSGYAALPWGHQGKGPVPACLTALVILLCLDMVIVDNMIDDLFRIDSASLPRLHRAGDLRPMVHAAFASMIMYFEERQLNNEMEQVRMYVPHSFLSDETSDAPSSVTNPREVTQ